MGAALRTGKPAFYWPAAVTPGNGQPRRNHPLGQVENAVMERSQGAAMADADDRGTARQSFDQPIEVDLTSLVESTGRLVEENRVGLLQQDSSEAHALLLSQRETLTPIVDFIKPPAVVTQPHGLKHFGDPSGRQVLGCARIQDSLAKAAKRQVGSLGQEQRAAGADSHLAAGERPQTGDRPKQRAATRPGRPHDQQAPTLCHLKGQLLPNRRTILGDRGPARQLRRHCRPRPGVEVPRAWSEALRSPPYDRGRSQGGP